jgi:CRP/FNR family transcriptional regulator, cyclic AMP receptor protein
MAAPHTIKPEVKKAGSHPRHWITIDVRTSQTCRLYYFSRFYWVLSTLESETDIRPRVGISIMDGSDTKALHEMDDLAFFNSVALFRDVPPENLKGLLALTTTETFAADDIILLEGEATNDLLIVRSGKVEVYVSRADQKIRITELGPTSYFGEMSVFDDYPRSANVRAVTEVVTYRIDRDSLRSFLKTNPAALYQMCTVFSHRLRNTNSALAKH